MATSTSLMRVNPANGAVVTTVALGFDPVALAPSYNGAWVYVLGYSPSRHLVLADYSAGSGQRLGSRRLDSDSDGPLGVAAEGVWVPEEDTATLLTTAQLFKGQHLEPSSTVGGLSFDTQPYVEDNILWLIDSAGRGPTICADPDNGRVRARGAPVGVEYDGAMAWDGGKTYLLHDVGVDESLLEITPTGRCSGS